ncbi:MAG: hypothetical protein B7Y40_09190 [Gammaproteobacteria bacterium 28-57-27]|nr:MAG: hypothetical protein B7Y40_09190 [Gammaproteobacteria bacterium 28-57-27]
MKARPSIHNSRGAALVVSLILLVIVTIMGVASMRGVTMQERMSSNMFDRSLAFQADEAGLRAIEPNIRNSADYPPDLAESEYIDNNCDVAACGPPNGLAGFCARPDPMCTDRWMDAGFAGWTNVPAAWLPAGTLGDLANLPQFFTEYMGQAPNWFSCEQQVPMHPNCMGERFRATIRSQATDRASTMLQATFAP